MIIKMAYCAGFSYDGSHFATSLEARAEGKRKRGKPLRRNSYLHYSRHTKVIVEINDTNE